MSALKAVVKNSDLDPTALAIAIEVANAALQETTVHRDIAQVRRGARVASLRRAF